MVIRTRERAKQRFVASKFSGRADNETTAATGDNVAVAVVLVPIIRLQCARKDNAHTQKCKYKMSIQFYGIYCKMMLLEIYIIIIL